jgi:WD40 repeat protein
MPGYSRKNDMNNAKNTKATVLFFFIAIAVIALVMILSRRNSPLVYELRFPLNNGVAELSSNNDSIAAACQDGKFYVWEWSKPAQKPQVLTLDSDQAFVTKSGLVISLKRFRPKAIVITDIHNQRQLRDISLKTDINRTLMGASRDKNFVVASLSRLVGNNDSMENYQLVTVDPNFGRVETVAEINPSSATRLFKLVVSDDGALALLTGEKEKKGWIVLVDVKNRKVIWEKQLKDVERFHSGAFSPDGSLIYARGSDCNVWKIETLSGKITGRLKTLIENQKSTVGEMSAQDMVISSDGRVVASIVHMTLYMWDTQTGKVIAYLSTGHKIINGLVLSPDNRFAATSALRQGGTIKIWRVPEH